MTYSPRAQELFAKEEAALASYLKAGLSVSYMPSDDNDRWFMDLMAKYNIPPFNGVHAAGRAAMLLVNE